MDDGVERIAIDALLPDADEPAADETGDDVGRDASLGKLGRRRGPPGAPASSSIASRCLACQRRRRARPSRPATVAAATRIVLCASARPPRAFGGRTAVIVSPGPAA